MFTGAFTLLIPIPNQIQQLYLKILFWIIPIEDAKLLGSESTRGFLFNADCNDHQLEQGFCPWKYFGMFDCEELLAVECAECNYVHHTADEELQEISIPAYVSCFTNTRCQWDIVNKHPRQKKIVLEFWKESANSSNGGNSSSDQVLEVRWLNLKLNNWALLQMTLGGADNMGRSPVVVRQADEIGRDNVRSCGGVPSGAGTWLDCLYLRQWTLFTFEQVRQKQLVKWNERAHRMVLTSKTGLLEGVRKPVKRQIAANEIEFPNFARPAPYILRPFSGVYNPFPYGCSILCNHPADYEAKDVVQRAKDSWVAEGKALLLPEELAAIRVSLLQGSFPPPYDDGEDAVPEELFRRYTDTDSRPLTPAPTLASITTKGSGRRCVTPDPVPTPARERTLLVLDLRRSHSQDALGRVGITAPDMPAPDPQTTATPKKKTNLKKKPAPSPKPEESVNQPQQIVEGTANMLMVPMDVSTDGTGGSGDEELTKRRGKHRRHRKKSGRDGSREPEKEFQGLAEPGETQVSALGSESRKSSNRPSLIPGTAIEALVVPDEQELEFPIPEVHGANDDKQKSDVRWHQSSPSSNIGCFQLYVRRHKQQQEIIENVFVFLSQRHRALEEALKFRPEQPPVISDEMRQLKRELRLAPSDSQQLLSLPRNFTRQSSRFELPLDSRLLNTMTPMEYIRNYVAISSGRRLLYNRVFNRHRKVLEEEEDGDAQTDRYMLGQSATTALGEVMGRKLKEEQCRYVRDLVGWQDLDQLDFRTWGGLSALCERLLAPQFIRSLPSRKIDPCQEVEQADFDTLSKRLRGLIPDPRLAAILHGIKEL
ncbi:hypothetical protein C0J52_04208 [Blattella germanica]|nr:hypothetical protein C0J52_04208 [Blattella germanica]